MVVPYAGLRTFLKSPTTKPTDAKYTIVGVPYDLSTTFRPGSRMGPAAIRDASLMLTDGHHPRAGVDPVEMGAVWDAGDIELEIGDTTGYLTDIQKVLKKYDFPIVLGGDHSVTLACLRNAYEKHGKLSVIQFDAHLDTWDGKPNHGTFMRQAVEEGIIDPSKTVQVGIRSPAPNSVYDWTKASGITTLMAHDIVKEKISRTMNKVYDVIHPPTAKGRDTTSPVYVTFDIDCINPGECPGTGTPEVGGLFTWQILELFDGLFRQNHTNYVGFDVMEVAPAYDPANVTALTAATLAWSFMCNQLYKG